MKASHGFTLLKFELLDGYLFSGIGTIVLFRTLYQSRDWDDVSLDLAAQSVAVIYAILAGCAYRLSFQRGASQLQGLEFLFSRPTSRPFLFGTRVTGFAFNCILPVLLFYFSNHSPVVTISLPRDASFPTFGRGAFYLAHFPGAFLQTIESRQFVVIPHGKASFTYFMLATAMVATAGYQALLLGTIRFRSAQWLIPLGIFVAAMLPNLPLFTDAKHFELAHNLKHHGPRYLESASFERWSLAFGTVFAWTIQHPLWTMALVLGFCAATLRFGCRCFGRQDLPR